RAGLPPTIVSAGTALETTDPAATIAARPMSAMITDDSPIQAYSPMSTRWRRARSVAAQRPFSSKVCSEPPLRMLLRLPIRHPLPEPARADNRVRADVGAALDGRLPVREHRAESDPEAAVALFERKAVEGAPDEHPGEPRHQREGLRPGREQHLGARRIL